MTAPTINDVISDGHSFISGLTEKEADSLVCCLQSCHLPLEIKREHIYQPLNLFERLFGILPEENAYESETLKSYLDETLT